MLVSCIFVYCVLFVAKIGIGVFGIFKQQLVITMLDFYVYSILLYMFLC